jgi:dTDP-4-amino-4,6-dideoxygalactose transaminase/nucleoside-diphosphate-sugar epimerase
MDSLVLLGGSGSVGSAITEALLSLGRDVTVVDRHPPPAKLVASGAQWIMADVLTDELPPLPPGEVAILLGLSDARPRWPWTLPVAVAVATARILPALAGRAVVLLSTVEIYGSAPGPLREDVLPRLPWTIEQTDDWCDEAIRIARDPCPPWLAAPAGRRMAAADPTGRWTYALSKLAQERLVMRAVEAAKLTILRLANVSGPGQERFTGRLIRRALAGRPLPVTATTRSFVPVGEVGRLVARGLPPGVYNVGGAPVSLVALAEEIRELCGSVSPLVPRQPPADDSCGMVDASRLAAAGHRIMPLRSHLAELAGALRADGRPVCEPALPVVIPPRAVFPDHVAARQQASLWSGEIKNGNRWSQQLRTDLAHALGAGAEHAVFVMASGTAALRLVVAATVGPAAPGEVALLPSFTFPATAEVLLQLGYRLRFVDVHERTWTLDPELLRAELASGPVRLVVCVDTFGLPCDYAALRRVCAEAGVPLIGDSAASLGSRHQGRPVAQQAAGHAYSMSFAKVLSAGGAGGAAVLPAAAATAIRRDPAGWCRSELMDELHAICALDQLPVLDELVRRRNRVAAIYRDGLPPMPGLLAQEVRPGDTHSYVHWVMRVPQSRGRDSLQRALLGCGVQTKPYFRALHMGGLGNGEPLPVTERLDAEALALPMSSELTDDDAEKVVTAVRHCLADAPRHLRPPPARLTAGQPAAAAAPAAISRPPGRPWPS